MNLPKPYYINLHQEIAQAPQYYLLIDLTGTYNTTAQGNTYAVTTICNLTSYLMTTTIPNKKTLTVAIHLFSEILLKFGFPRILHSDSGTEFNSKHIEYLAQELGIKKTYISPCHTQSNGKLESSHRFLMDCIQKFSNDGILEWEQLLLYAKAAFNLFPTEHSQESLHFLYFGCNPYLLHFPHSYNQN